MIPNTPHTMMLVLLSAWSVIATASEPDASAYALCQDICIVVDAQGQRIGTRAYDGIEDIVGDLVIYKRGDRYGIANLKGETLVAPSHQYLHRVGRGLIAGIDDMPSNSIGINHDRITFYALDGRKVAERAANTNESVEAHAWRENTYALRCVWKDGNRTDCRYEFIDGEGRTLAEFESFDSGDNRALLAPARVPGGLTGYVDESLSFVIAPRFQWAYRFEGGIARVTLQDDSAGLIDTRGRLLIPAGRYTSAYAFENERYVNVYRKDSRCGEHYTRKGRRLRTPEDLCVHDGPSLDQPNVIIVKNAANKFGAIDHRGRITVPTQFDGLEYFNNTHLRFRDDSSKRYGLLSLRGEIVLPADYEELRPFRNEHPPYEMRDDRVIARVGTMSGMLGLDGRWIMPMAPGRIEVLDMNLIVRSVSSEAKSLLDADGRELGITFKYDAFAHRGLPDRFELHKSDSEGVIDDKGQWVLPPKFRSVELRPDGYFAVEVWDESKRRILRGLYDRDGREILAPMYAELGYAYAKNMLTVTTADWRKQLVDRNGRVIAEWQSLTPERLNSGDAILEAQIDPCFIADPTAEPPDLPSRQPGLAEHCTNPAHRARLRETRLQAVHAMGGDCLPLDLHRAFSAHTANVAACTTSSCIEQARLSLAERLPALIAQCPKPRRANGSNDTAPVTDAVIRALRPLLDHIAAKQNPADAPIEGYRYSWLDPSSPRDRVVVWAELSDPRYIPFHVFERRDGGLWRATLSDAAGSIAVFDATDPARADNDWIGTTTAGNALLQQTYWRRNAKGDFEPGLVCESHYSSQEGSEYYMICSDPASKALDAP